MRMKKLMMKRMRMDARKTTRMMQSWLRKRKDMESQRKMLKQ